MADGFVAVGVRQHDVVLRDDAVADNLVRRAGSAEHVERPVGPEYTGSIALRLARRADMIKPRAERRGRDTEVRAKEIFAEEPVKLLPDRMLEEGDTAHVAGRVPRVGGLIVVFEKLAKVRRQQLIVITLDGGIEARGDKRGSVAEQMDVFMDLLHDFQRQFGDQCTVGDKENGNLLVAVPNAANNVECGALFKLGVAFEVPIEKNSRITWIRCNERKAILRRCRTDHCVTLIANGVDQTLHGSV